MNCKVNSQSLAKSIGRIQGGLLEKSLGNIGLKVSDSKLSLAAFDRTIAIYCTIDCTAQETGEVFVPAKLFSDLVKELPDGEVYLERKDSWVKVLAGENQSFSMQLPCLDDTAWKDPSLAHAQSVSAEIDAEKFAYMIDQVLFTISHESSRNYASVGYMHKVKNDQFRLVGTDGFRLSYCETQFDTPEGFLSQGVCLSKRALLELSKMASEGFEKIKLTLTADNSTLVAQVPDYSIYILLSAVRYPNYKGVLPKKLGIKMEISRSLLQSVSKRVLLAADKTRSLQLNLTPSHLTLSSKSSGASEGHENIALNEYNGSSCKLAINGKYFTDALNNMSSPSLDMLLETEEHPIILKPKEELENCHSQHILVPIRERD